jgi:hypothetical protein
MFIEYKHSYKILQILWHYKTHATSKGRNKNGRKPEERFLGEAAGYRMTYNKCKANIRRELGIIEINVVKRMIERRN